MMLVIFFKDVIVYSRVITMETVFLTQTSAICAAVQMGVRVVLSELVFTVSRETSICDLL